jgi:hypothetical protein
MHPMSGFARRCGFALMLGGASMILINVILTPLLPGGHSSAVTMSSRIFVIRQSASCVAALLLLLSCIGVHLAQRMTAGLFGGVAFSVAFVGGCLLFAVEWTNVFVLHPLARTPEAMVAFDKAPLSTIGFASAAGLLALG